MALGKKPNREFYLFGGLCMERDGKEWETPPYRYHDVLTYLMLNVAQPIRRCKLVGDVFFKIGPERARARLSDYLWFINRFYCGSKS